MNLKYRWVALFKKKTIKQPLDDRYSKHDPTAEWNPSSFRDFQDYFDEHQNDLELFHLISEDADYAVDLTDQYKPKILETRRGSHWGSDKTVILHREKRPLSDVRIIYYRKMELKVINGQASSPEVVGYDLGYQGIDKNGNNRQKTITVL
jgi:hypothetical protein